MDHLKIRKLSELFWEGKSTEEQEVKLKEFFAFGEVPEDLRDTADYFKYLEDQQLMSGLDLGFDEKVLEKITRKKQKSFFPTLTRIAAGAAILFGLFFGSQFFDKPVNPVITVEDSFEDPEQAYLEVKKALFLLSGKMNEGTDHGKALNKFSFANQEIKVENEIKQ